MNFIRYTASILISLSLIGCANTKTPNVQKKLNLGKQVMMRFSDDSLVRFLKASMQHKKIIESSITTTAEKEKAEALWKSQLEKYILSIDSDAPIAQYNEQDEVDVEIDLAVLKKKIQKNNVDYLEAILSLPTYNAARLIRLMSEDRKFFLKPKN